ncbi:hypothetical protein [Planotetraspora sp. GP83]|uniref:hypothetical protein n=1 Tax=Planotetraspora sp. GP83 TaxID=3156264 RepID=UPI003511DCFD
MGSMDTRVWPALVVVMLTAALVLAGCRDSDPGNPAGAGTVAATGTQQGTTGAGQATGNGQGGSPGASGGGNRQSRYTLTSGPTLDGDFSAPIGTNAGVGCRPVRGGTLGEVRVRQVRFIQEEPQVFTFGGGAVTCTSTAQVLEPCEGSVLKPGTECLFMAYGRGEVNSRARLVLTLEQNCVNRDTPACGSLPASARPSPDAPVTVTWHYSVPFYYCARTPVGPTVEGNPCAPAPELSPSSQLQPSPTDPVPTDPMPTTPIPTADPTDTGPA